MEYKIKAGYVLVKKDDALQDATQSKLFAGSVVGGAPEDMGINIFFTNYTLFNEDMIVVKVDDILVWAPKEEAV